MSTETQSNTARPHPPSGIEALLAEMNRNLETLPELLVKLQPLFEKGTTLGELKSVTADELEQIYKVAYDLCQQEAYEDALTVLLNLIAHNPRDPRFHFATAMCFQQIQEPIPAAMLYAQALLLDPADAASAFRMGEALAATGQLEQATQAFDMALVLINADYDRYHHLYGPAQTWLQQLRVTPSATAAG
jgi:tetratricopeptide (TPR) repeat protein